VATLALDLGTHTGYACRTDNVGTTISGTWDFSTKRHEDAGMRFVRFREALVRMRLSNGVDKIYFEEVRRHAGTTAAHIYGGFVAMLKAFCVDTGVSYESVPVGDIKKYWTGKGNAKKDAMVAEARRRGYEPVDDNEADAIAILCMKME
jgi:Holliday junction resolvasome RuvABC endonuclease subunit